MFFLSLNSFTQGLSQLGSSEKVWVLLHPFSANKANAISKMAIELADSIVKTKDWLKINSGGRKDAFRHGIWMAMMSSDIGPKRALWLGKAHEKKNVKDFKKNRLEEGQIPDQRSVEMDLYNNQVGVSIGTGIDFNCDRLILEVLTSIANGKFKMIKMDRLGNSLNDNNVPIDQWEGNWINERLLVFTN